MIENDPIPLSSNRLKEFDELRDVIPYHPFASPEDKDLATFLIREGLSQGAINRFFETFLNRKFDWEKVQLSSYSDIFLKLNKIPLEPWVSVDLKGRFPTYKNDLKLMKRNV